jgi:hypothetical protein
MKKLESKSVVLLHHHLKALRLPTIGSECEATAARAAADNVDHLSYLLQLSELELLERERKAAERRLNAARFPVLKTLETFDFLARPSVNKGDDLPTCPVRVHRPTRERPVRRQPRHRQEPPRAIALSAAACSKGYRVRFHRVTELVTQLIEARDERGLMGVKARLAKLDLLVLDEFGFVPVRRALPPRSSNTPLGSRVRLHGRGDGRSERAASARQRPGRPGRGSAVGRSQLVDT